MDHARIRAQARLAWIGRVTAHGVVKEATRAAEVLECGAYKRIDFWKCEPHAQKFHQPAVYFYNAFCRGFRMKDVLGVGDEHGSQRVREIVSGVGSATAPKGRYLCNANAEFAAKNREIWPGSGYFMSVSALVSVRE